MNNPAAQQSIPRATNACENGASPEHAYRTHFLRQDALSFTVLVVLFIVFNLLLFRADARIWPSGPIRVGLMALRCFHILASAVVIAVVLRTDRPAIFDRWAQGWGLMLALTNNAVILSRPAIYTGNIFPELMAIIAMFAVMPDRMPHRLLPPLLLAAGSLTLLFGVKQLPEPVALLSLVFSYIVTLTMGFWLSKIFFRYRREAFQARRELEAAHRETSLSEQLYRFLVQNNHGVIFIVQADGVISFISSSWTRKLGHTVEQVLGRDYRDFLHPDDVPLCTEFLQYSLAVGGVQESVRYRAVHADGSFRWYQTTIMACYDEQKTITSFIGNGIDVTEQVLGEMELRRARDESEAANTAKSEFLALVSHEIRTPLNALVGFSALARTISDQKKLCQYLDILDQASSSLMALVNDILDMSKIEAGGLTLETVPFSMRAVLTELEQQCRAQAEQKHLYLRMDIDPDLPDWLSGDPVRVRQILANLLSNAVKFTEQGGIRCSVTVDGQNSPVRRLRIVVQDSGIGIPQDKLNELFKPFHQLDPSITRKFGGTGLGLAIVASLIHRMEGSIHVESTAGQGSTFSVVLPFWPAEAPEDKPSPVVSFVAPLAILVVEDNAFNRLLLEEMLTLWNHSVTLADNGESGLQLLAEQRFDLILLDLRMPGIDGIEVARRITQTRCSESEVKIIAITADADAATRTACLAAGITTVLTKPLSADKLAQAIAQHCGGGMQSVTTERPLLTSRTLAGLGPNPERARQYMAMLLLDIQENLACLDAACACDEREELGRRAHTLKGLFSHLTDPVPVDLCAWLQHNAATASSEQLQRYIVRLHQRYRRQDQPETDYECAGTDIGD